MENVVKRGRRENRGGRRESDSVIGEEKWWKEENVWRVKERRKLDEKGVWGCYGEKVDGGRKIGWSWEVKEQGGEENRKESEKE